MVSPINNHTGIRFIIGGIAAAIAILIFSGVAEAGTYIPPATDWTSAEQSAGEQKVLLWSDAGLTDDAYAGMYRMATSVGAESTMSTLAGDGVSFAGMSVTGTVLPVLAVSLWTYDAKQIYRLFTGEATAAGSGNHFHDTWQKTCQQVNGFTFPGGGTTCSAGVSWVLGSSGQADTFCITGSCPTNTNADSYKYSGTHLSSYFTGGSICGGASGSFPAGSCDVIGRSESDMEQYVQVKPIDAATYNSYPSGEQKALPSTAKEPAPPTMDVTKLQTALTTDHCETPDSQSASDEAACTALATAAGVSAGYPIPDCVGLTVTDCETAYTGDGLSGSVVATPTTTEGANVTYPAGAIISQDPAGGSQVGSADTDLDVTTNPDAGGMPFNIPAPSVNETYSDYVARLQTLGYLGTITEVDLTDATGDESMGPDAIARVAITTGTLTGSVYYPLAWPSTNPKIAAADSITLYKNPPDYSPAPTATGTGTSGEPGNCSDCSIDWTPIESLNFGSAFPFGLPGWISSFFGNFNQSGTCPTLSIGKPDVLGGGTENISFCSSDWENTWRPIVFPVLEALMTAAGVVFFATKILGYGNADS